MVKIVGKKYDYVGDYSGGWDLYFSIKYKNKAGNIEKEISFLKNMDYSFNYEYDYYGDIEVKAKNLDFIIDKDNIYYNDFIKFLSEKEKIVIEDDEPRNEDIENVVVKKIEFSKNEDNNVLIRFSADNEFNIHSMNNVVMVKNILPDIRSRIDLTEAMQKNRGEKPDELKNRLAVLFKDMKNSFEKEYYFHYPEKVKEGR